MNERITIYFQSIKVKFVKHNKGEEEDEEKWKMMANEE